jgi:hypothetical protein
MQVTNSYSPNSTGNLTNFTIASGEYVTLQFAFANNGTALDLTGYSAKMQINFPSPLLLQTPSSGLSIPTPANGIVNLTIQTTQTDVVAGTYPYDFWLIISGEPIPYMSGNFIVTPSRTPVP